MVNLDFKMYEEKISGIVERFYRLIGALTEPELQTIIEQINTELKDAQDKMKLEIAFVGQYSAGKSTIISALTGDSSIEIGQDVTTNKPYKHTWGNVVLVDTPGILAGREEHDELTLKWIDKADLLVYVVTVNGFDQIIGNNFKKLAFEEKRISKMMLIMNKLSEEPIENKCNWENSILPIIHPLSSKDVGLTFIDAKEYIYALSIPDVKMREEFIHLSNFNEFQERLNEFIKEKGLIGRLISPLNIVQTSSMEFISRLKVNDKKILKVRELYQQKEYILLSSKKKLKRLVQAEINHLSSIIVQKGHELANMITPDMNQEELQSMTQQVSAEIDETCQETSYKIDDLVEKEIDYLLKEINELMASPLAQDVWTLHDISFGANVEIKDYRLNDMAKKLPDLMKNVGGLLNAAGKNFYEWAQNAENVGKNGLKAVAGGDAHKAVLQIGHFFGKKFRPYEAQKIALKMGNAAENMAKFGKVLGAAQIILAPAMAIYEEHQENKYYENLKNARMQARDNFKYLAGTIQSNYTEGLDKIFNSLHDLELKEVGEQMAYLRADESTHNRVILELEEVYDLARKCIEEIETSKLLVN